MHTLDLSIHPVNSTLKMLASLLERITTANDKIKQSLPEPESPMVMTPRSTSDPYFVHKVPCSVYPSISINAYLTRILKYCPCANECFLSLLVYFDRMARNVEEITGGEGRQFSIDSYNIHRLIIAGIMVSAKYFSDVFFTNSRYAKVGGLPVSELNQLEVEFLTLNNFALAISIEELQTYGDQLMKHWMCEEVANRDPEDETPSPAVPSAPTPTPPSNEREYSNGDAEQGGSSRYAEHHDPRYESSSRPSPSQKQPSQHQHQDTVRREVRQDDHHHHRQAQHRQDYRNNSHASEPRHDQRKEHRQDQGRDYRQDPHHQVSSHSQQQHSHQYRHRQGQEPTLDRSYMSDRPGRYQTPPNGPITPTEMTHATSRLAAPSPIH